ncbi:MAG: MarR family transcriptional regulator [Pseudomonadales bacterium]|nr:MarR family transcriptional regulator [Pseudomonadales bacterium]
MYYDALIRNNTRGRFMPSATKRNYTPSDCVCFAMRSAARAVTALYDTKMAEANLTNGQFTILSVLSGRGRLKISELQKVCQVEQSTMSREVRTLRERGLVERVPSEDARVRLFQLTRTGKQKLKQAEVLWGEVHDEMRSSLGLSAMTGLLDSLNDIKGLVQQKNP